MDAPSTRRTRVVREGLSFGESPRWHEGRLWYSDFYRRAVFSCDPEGREERREFDAPGQPSGLGWLPDGDLLYVSMSDRTLRRRRGGDERVLADLAPHGGFWANELLVAGDGVCYVGSFGFDLDLALRDQGLAALASPPSTNLVVLGPDGALRQVVPDMLFPNGTALSEDGATLVVAETLASRVSAFDVAADGTLSGRRVFAELDGVAVDGLCLDAAGSVWVADALRPRCLRVREGGAITDVVATSQRAFACVLGGDARRSLYVMTAPTSDRFVAADRRDGRVEVATVDVAGAGRP